MRIDNEKIHILRDCTLTSPVTLRVSNRKRALKWEDLFSILKKKKKKKKKARAAGKKIGISANFPNEIP